MLWTSPAEQNIKKTLQLSSEQPCPDTARSAYLQLCLPLCGCVGQASLPLLLCSCCSAAQLLNFRLQPAALAAQLLSQRAGAVRAVSASFRCLALGCGQRRLLLCELQF